MNEGKTEIRLQFKSQAGFFGEHAEGFRNEFVIQLKPKNSMYMKLVVKKPGLEMDAITAELNLSYNSRCAYPAAACAMLPHRPFFLSGTHCCNRQHEHLALCDTCAIAPALCRS